MFPCQPPALSAKAFYCLKKVELRKRVKLWHKEQGVEEGTESFIYGVISVRFKF